MFIIDGRLFQSIYLFFPHSLFSSLFYFWYEPYAYSWRFTSQLTTATIRSTCSMFLPMNSFADNFRQNWRSKAMRMLLYDSTELCAIVYQNPRFEECACKRETSCFVSQNSDDLQNGWTKSAFWLDAEKTLRVQLGHKMDVVVRNRPIQSCGPKSYRNRLWPARNSAQDGK